MQRNRLSRLTHIATMKKEMELASLARLARERDAAQAHREELVRAEQEARRAAAASSDEARVAEQFTRWVQHRHVEVDSTLQRLTAEMSIQKDKAAGAVGRHDVLGKIEGSLRAAERQARREEP